MDFQMSLEDETPHLLLHKPHKVGPNYRYKWSYKLSHTIHVWYSYLHLVDFYGKCMVNMP